MRDRFFFFTNCKANYKAISHAIGHARCNACGSGIIINICERTGRLSVQLALEAWIK